MDCYYLVASLPYLEFGQAPPFDGNEFLQRCAGIIDDAKLQEVASVLNGRIGECESGFGCDLVSAETQLRNAVVRIRASKKGVDPRAFLREHSAFRSWVEKMVVDAFTRENPREREMALDHARWQIADELTGVESFTFGKILAFAAKLRILIRWSKMERDKGAESVEKFILDSGMENTDE